MLELVHQTDDLSQTWYSTAILIIIVSNSFIKILSTKQKKHATPKPFTNLVDNRSERSESDSIQTPWTTKIQT